MKDPEGGYGFIIVFVHKSVQHMKIKLLWNNFCSTLCIREIWK